MSDKPLTMADILKAATKLKEGMVEAGDGVWLPLNRECLTDDELAKLESPAPADSVCPACGSAVTCVRCKLVCPKCHRIVENCCAN